ncbi:MAG: F0F1 ATP synthase subunit A [Anaerolineales bacterium]|nr:F0F1 ATP synthase subunit A [Anaerolineales bacterium]
MRKAIIVVAVLGLVVFMCGPLTRFLFVSLGISPYGAFPVVALPAEPLPIPWFGGEEMTNTFLTTLIVDVLLLLLFGITMRYARKGALLPPKSKLANVTEALTEVFYNFANSIGGKRGKSIFPMAATIFFLVLTANWFKLLPGAESIGIVEAPHLASVKAYAPRLIEWGPLSFYTLDGTQPREAPHAEDGLLPEAGHAEGEGLCEACVITPFVRGPATDLNFTLGLALVTMVMVQVWGVRAQGAKYFYKFINIPAIRQGGMGYMLFLVGLLEIISELSRIISFAFRLLGNIFAGTVLIFVMSFLVPFILPAGFYGIEVAVGMIQAAVFALLALVFISMATHGHGDEAQGSPAAEH